MLKTSFHKELKKATPNEKEKPRRNGDFRVCWSRILKISEIDLSME